MRVRRKTLWAKINAKGEPKVAWQEFEYFCRLHPNRNIIVRVEVQSIEPSPKIKAYFFGYVVKELQRAMYDNGEDLTEEQVYNKVRRECPMFVHEERTEQGEWKVRLREWEELDSAEAVEVVSWVHRYAAENYYLILSDPQ